VKTDLTDIFAMRDAGWLLFLAESQQELLDTLVMAYRISEDSKVLLPSLVNVDGIANMRDPVNVPNKKVIGNFLPKLRMPRKIKDNVAVGGPVLEGYEEFREQQQLAMRNALALIEKTAEKWKEKFKRPYGLVEKYLMDDADYAIVTGGFYSAAARNAIRLLRSQGEKVGLLRARVVRPWPYSHIADALKNVRKIAVVDRGVSLGATGFMHNELRSVHAFCSSFISFKPLAEKDFLEVFSRLKKGEKAESVWV
jgi:pyruvate ferredoxin oxidoreductase alpha subunit